MLEYNSLQELYAHANISGSMSKQADKCSVEGPAIENCYGVLSASGHTTVASKMPI